MEDDGFRAAQHVAIAVAPRAGLDIGERITRAWLAMSEGKHELALGEGRQDRLFLRGAAYRRDDAAAKHDACEIRFEHEAAAEGFHDDHALDRRAAEAAMLLGEGQAQEADLGIARPQLAAEAFGRALVAFALLEAVFVLDEPPHRLVEQPLLLAQIKVHDAFLRGFSDCTNDVRPSTAASRRSG